MNALIIGEKYKEKLGKCRFLNDFELFWLENNPNVDERLSGHTDLSIFIYKKIAVLADYLRENEVVKFLTNRGINVIVSESCQYNKYPGDIALCAAIVGNKLLHCIKYTDKNLLDLDIEIVNVKQGYTRCSCLVVGNSIITSDKGIAKAAEENDINYLLIDEGGIALDGFDKGFVGGASFVANDTVYFTGDIMKHPNGEAIVDFITRANHKVRCLTDNQLFDIGSAIVIT